MMRPRRIIWASMAKNKRWMRWDNCSLCEQQYHGVVRCALGWGLLEDRQEAAEDDQVGAMAMSVLGYGLFEADHYEEAVTVQEAELSLGRRHGTSLQLLSVQGNLANSYQFLGRLEPALRMRQDVYSGCLRLFGEHENTVIAANNLASSLLA